MFNYQKEYAQKYIETTLSSDYTIYKNETIASTIGNMGISSIWDLGGNVSGLMKVEGSLRFQLDKKNIGYSAVDIVPAYFSPSFAKSLGQPDCNIYETINAIVADMRRLPLATESVEGVVCADVIEHIEKPQLALSEMYRVLKHRGKAIMIIPSLYKLDALKFPHILHQRFSSHENKLLITEWMELVASAGFKIDRHNSRPLGIASGLLYTTWLNSNYVPIKEDADATEKFSEKAMLFRKAKSAVTKVDKKIDEWVLRNDYELNRCREKFSQGDLRGILELVKQWYNLVTTQSDESLYSLVKTFAEMDVDYDRKKQLITTMHNSQKATRNDMFFGNAALLVLSK